MSAPFPLVHCLSGVTTLPKFVCIIFSFAIKVNESLDNIFHILYASELPTNGRMLCFYLTLLFSFNTVNRLVHIEKNKGTWTHLHCYPGFCSVNIPQFIHFPINGPLLVFKNFTIINFAAMNALKHKCFKYIPKL